jgi:hypothetical protein
MEETASFDPNLKDAMEEIKDLLKRYDIGGYVSLVSPTHSEFLLVISPLWSCAHFETLPNGERQVRFRATEKQYGSKEARDKAIEVTTHLFMQIRDLGGQAFMFGDMMHDQLSNFYQIDHTPFFKG